MKKAFFSLVVSAFIIGTMFTSCQSSTGKATKEKNNLIEAQKDSIQQFKAKSLAQISHYEKSISELKAGLKNDKMEISATYKKQMADLEQKSNDLKKKLEDYKEEGVEKWVAFKNEFNHDMDVFGKAFKDLTVENVK